MSKTDRFEGPTCYVHWHRYTRERAGETDAEEYFLYSDAHLTGSLEDRFEPFSVMNRVPPYNRYGYIQAVMVFRTLYLENHAISEGRIGNLFYHKSRLKYHFPGRIKDEIASLLSLALGVRLKAGSSYRWFPASNRYGTPILHDHDSPIFNFQPRENPRLPWTMGPISINSAEPLLKSFFRMPPSLAYRVLLASRLYQEALWVAESQPELSWLLLVSAVEVAAGRQSQKQDCVELLKLEKPSWYDALRNSPNELREIAEHWASLSGATKKFVQFLVTDVPPPPSRRPDPSAQVDWTDNVLCKMCKEIYKQRSRMLHSGIPFSKYLCVPPLQHHSWNAPSEITDGVMTLHVFEYIVRHRLTSWWVASAGSQHLAPGSAST